MVIWVSVVVYCANKSCTQAGTSLNHCNTINTLKGLKNRTISLISTHMSCHVWPIVVAPLSGKNINTSIGKPGLFSDQPTGGWFPSTWRHVFLTIISVYTHEGSRTLLKEVHMLYYAENFSENNALDWFEDIKQPIFCDKNYFCTDQRVVSRSSQSPARIEMYK